MTGIYLLDGQQLCEIPQIQGPMIETTQTVNVTVRLLCKCITCLRVQQLTSLDSDHESGVRYEHVKTVPMLASCALPEHAFSSMLF